MLSEDWATLKNEKIFLIPVTFELSIKRNLSPSWFKIIPEFEVLAHLGTVHVALTHEDLCNIVSIIKENLSEEVPDHSKENLKHSGLKTDNKYKEHEYHQPELEDVDVKEEENSNFYTVVKFAFFMDSFLFDALTETNKRVCI